MEAHGIAKELLEEIRTNTKLRHRLGMSEGADSDLLEEDGSELGIRTDDGVAFLIQVTEA